MVRSKTYIRMPANFFDGSLVKVAGVAQEASANRIGVLQAIKDLAGEGRLATLPQLELTGLLVGRVDIVEPDMVLRGVLIRDVLLELDDVSVRDGLRVDRGQQGGSITVDSLGAERRDDSRRDAGREGESSKALHCECWRCGSVLVWRRMTTEDKERCESASDRIEEGNSQKDNHTQGKNGRMAGR